MATEKQANLAREQHSDSLLGLGVHSIGVDEIDKEGTKTFAVIAYTEKKSSDLPSHLEVKSGNKTFRVPLITKLAKPFTPE